MNAFALLLLAGTMAARATVCDEAWTSFWSAVGLGMIAEVPTADIESASAALGALETCAPDDWRVSIARGEIAHLQGNPDLLDRSARQAALTCNADPTCDALARGLLALGAQDRYTSLGRAWMSNEVLTREPARFLGVDRDTGALLSSSFTASPDARPVLAAWYTSCAFRNPWATEQYARYTPNAEQMRSVAAGSFMPAPRDPLGPLLKHLIDSRSPTPADAISSSIASWFETARRAAPEGTIEEVNINLFSGPVEAKPFLLIGLSAPSRPVASHDLALSLLQSTASASLDDGSRLSVLRRLAAGLAHIHLRDPGAANLEAEAARQKARRLGIQDLESSADLLSARAWIVAGQEDKAIPYLEAAFTRANGIGAYGQAASVLLVWGRLAQEVFWVEGRLPEGDQMGRSALEKAVSHGYTSAVRALGPQVTAATGAADLPAETVERADLVLGALSRLDEIIASRRATLDTRIPPAMTQALLHPGLVAGDRVNVLLEKLNALADLGASWSVIQPVMEETIRQASIADQVSVALGQALGRKSSATHLAQAMTQIEPGLKVRALSSAGETGTLMAQARASGDKDLQSLLAGAQGDSVAVMRIEEELRQASIPAIEGPERWVLHQALADRRRSYLETCATAAQGRAVLEAWRSDPYSSQIAARRPWIDMLLEAQVLEAEGRNREAESLLESLLGRIEAGTWRDLPRSKTSLLPASPDARDEATLNAAYVAATRLALDRADQGAHALALWDTLLWRKTRRSMGDGTTLPPPYPDPATLAAALSPETRVVMVATLGLPREAVVWVATPKGELQVLRVPWPRETNSLGAALRLIDTGQAPPFQLATLGSWLAEQVPPGAPVRLVSSTDLRASMLTWLDVDGEPLALRNPVVWAPSLRDAAAADERASTGKGSTAAGVPVTPSEDSDRRAIEAIRADRLLWREDATVDAVRGALATSAVMHLSAHGRMDSLDPQGSGLQLWRGSILRMTDLRAARVPGSIVVLSACESGVPNARGAALDLAILEAGARTVVSTPLNRVQVSVASRWTRLFHHYLDRGDRPVMAAWRASRKIARSTKKPNEWGAFLVSGAG